MDLKIKLIQDGKKPTKGSPLAACHDLYARKIQRISRFKVRVYLGVAIQPPSGYKVVLYPRSSISKTNWILANSVGIGDPDYTGEYMAIFNYIGPKSGMLNAKFPFSPEDRCAQFEIAPITSFDVNIVDKLNETKRGDGGFGSTGK